MPVRALGNVQNLDVFYRYLIEYFVSEVIECLETPEAMSISTMNV